MLNCIDDKSKWNKIMDLGGPDEGMTMKEQVLLPTISILSIKFIENHHRLNNFVTYT